MLTSEIRINGALLGHLYMTNTMVRDDGKILYTVEYYKTSKGIARTTVLHNPDDGCEKLTTLALSAIMKTKAYKEMTNGQ